MPVGDGDVDAGVQASPAHPERRDDRSADRPRELAGARGRGEGAAAGVGRRGGVPVAGAVEHASRVGLGDRPGAVVGAHGGEGAGAERAVGAVGAQQRPGGHAGVEVVVDRGVRRLRVRVAAGPAAAPERPLVAVPGRGRAVGDVELERAGAAAGGVEPVVGRRVRREAGLLGVHGGEQQPVRGRTRRPTRGRSARTRPGSRPGRCRCRVRCSRTAARAARRSAAAARAARAPRP